MKTKAIITILVLFFGTYPAKGDVIWTEGHHEINDGDSYFELEIYNDVTLDIFGGDIYYVFAFDSTITNWYDGQMTYFVSNDNSIANIYGGILFGLGSGENSQINLYAYDIQHHLTGGHWDSGWVEGRYFMTNRHFEFDLWGQDTYSHINIVPEPATILLLGLGSIIVIRKRR